MPQPKYRRGPSRTIPFRLHERELTMLDRYADRHAMTRADAVRAAIHALDHQDSVRSPEHAPPSSARAGLLTPDELADRWSVPKSQVYRLARKGQIPTVEIGRYKRFSLAAIEAYEAS